MLASFWRVARESDTCRAGWVRTGNGGERMRANGDMLAECWEKRDLHTLLAQRFGMFAMEELAEELERKHDDVVRLTLGKSELPVNPALTDAVGAAARPHSRSRL